MKVAFTSRTGDMIDEHFGTASHVFVWDLYPERSEFIGKVSILSGDGDEEDRIAARANAVAGCVIVYTQLIGGPAAARLVARRIHPLKTTVEVSVAETIAKLQDVLRGTPPPWLRKAMARESAPVPAE